MDYDGLGALQMKTIVFNHFNSLLLPVAYKTFINFVMLVPLFS